MNNFDYDLFVIGGGSGGVRAARVASGLGKKVAVAEEYRFGGTCVIRGCVPKKIFVYASQFPEHFEDAAGYGWTLGESSFSWQNLIAAKDKEIDRLEGLYRKGLNSAGAEIIESRAEIIGPNRVLLLATNKEVTAEKILIAVGGTPTLHEEVRGYEHCISSNEAFHLDELPKSIIVTGGGYIAVEFANIFHGLGVDTHLIYRGSEILRGFDMDMRVNLRKAMEKKGIHVHLNDSITAVSKVENGHLKVETKVGEVLNVGKVMMALGRSANTSKLGLESVGVEMDSKGAIVVDDYSRTNVEGIYAVGDVTDRVQLTPVAIHEAMCFIETEYKNNPTRPDHDLIATAVFSQPEIGTVGLAEDAAAKRYDELEIYLAKFRPMKATLSGRDERTVMKLIVNAEDRAVVGVHILGHESGEMAQLLGIALKGGCTKDDFDRTMAVHPTASEEFVTMYQPSYRVKNGVRV